MRTRVPVGALIAALLCTSCVAQHTAANSSLTTYFTATYTDSVGGSHAAVSPQASCRVRQVFGLTASIDKGNWLTVAEGKGVDVACTITNTGNGPDTFSITPQAAPAGWSLSVLDDSNGNGIRDPGEWTDYSASGELQRGETHHFFVTVWADNGSILNDGLKSSLTVKSIGAAASSPLYWNGLVVAGRQAMFYCEDSYPLSHKAGTADAGGDDQSVFLADASGYVYTATVTPFQGYYDSIKTTKLAMGAPAITSDRVMWVTTDGALLTIDKSQKALLRTVNSPDGTSFRDSPAVYGSVAIVATNGGKLYAISRDGVAILSSDHLINPIRTPPLVVGTNLFVGTDHGEIACFDVNSLQLKYVDIVDSNAHMSGKLAADTTGTFIAATSESGRVYSYGIASRSVRWSRVLPAPAVGIAICDNRGAYFLCSNRELDGYDLQTGDAEPGFPFQVPGTTPLSSGLSVARRAAGASQYLWFGTPESMIYAVCSTLGLHYYHCDLSWDKSEFLTDPSIAAGKVAFGADIGKGYLFCPK